MTARRTPRAPLRQVVIGLILLPLSAMPFVAYATLTPEGRLVRDRVLISLKPPSLPILSPARAAAVRARAPKYRDGVMVLVYHGIGTADGDGGFAISQEQFAEHLVALRAAGMTTVTASDVARAFAGGPPLPANAVMITFDDGRADAMMYADPLLAQARMRATMFVIADAATDHGVYYASWGAIRRYAKSGRWDIQSHTARSHREQRVRGGAMLPVLTSLRSGETIDQYRARVRADLAKARAEIVTHTGRAPVALAFPFGAYGADRTNDPRIRAVLRDEVAAQYRLAFHQDDQETVPLATCGSDPASIRRLEVGNWSAMALLDRIRAAAGRTRTGGPCRVVRPGGGQARSYRSAS